MSNKRIYLSPPHMGGQELEFITTAFHRNWIAPAGPDIDEFESSLSSYVGMPWCAALSSGTAAIHLALQLLGVKADDEVVCSSFTFAGSCNPIVYLGAKPVFVDAEPNSWNMDPDLLRRCVKSRMASGKKPAAIIVVHLYGMPAEMERIMEIAREFDIPVIEDAAEALGASLNGKRLGSFGDVGILSFNGNKIITTSGGGALLSNNKLLVDKARFLATQARDPAPHYEHTHIGYNYRLSNISACIGLGQMKVIDERVARRRWIFTQYHQALEGLGLGWQVEPPGGFSNRWLTCILVPDGAKCSPEQIRLALEGENMESRPLWKPMHLQPVYSSALTFDNGISARLFHKGLCLPSGTAMTEEDILRVVTVIIRMLKGF